MSIIRYEAGMNFQTYFKLQPIGVCLKITDGENKWYIEKGQKSITTQLSFFFVKNFKFLSSVYCF